MATKSSNLPSRVAIVEFWIERDPVVFYELVWNEPGCFACGYIHAAANRSGSLETQWEHSHLERCHLLGKAEGGSCLPVNLVLLCQRCHRAAPSVGITPQPMIDWINRREGYSDWFLNQLREECSSISPTLIEDLWKSDWKDSEEFRMAMRTMFEFMRLGRHTHGDMFASIAAAINGLVQLERLLRRKVATTQAE